MENRTCGDGRGVAGFQELEHYIFSTSGFRFFFSLDRGERVGASDGVLLFFKVFLFLSCPNGNIVIKMRIKGEMSIGNPKRIKLKLGFCLSLFYYYLISAFVSFGDASHFLSC